MIKSVTVTNHLGESITLELAFPEKSGFAVQSIEGLGPPKATINTTELATIDGAYYSSARVGPRNIVLSLLFMHSPTIEQVRQKSYKYFPIKKNVTLLIETDTRTCQITGYVESNEPDIFSREESTQISIICPDPYFYEINKSVTIFSGVDPMFEFEFSNESLTDGLIEFGSIINKTEETVYYAGDADTGVLIVIHAVGPATGIAIFNTTTQEMMRINTAKILALTGTGISAGDDIIINTVKGNKSIFLLREGVYTNILNCLDKDVDWFHLTKGDNVFIYTADSGAVNLQFRIENQVLYEGV